MLILEYHDNYDNSVSTLEVDREKQSCKITKLAKEEHRGYLYQLAEALTGRRMEKESKDDQGTVL